MRFVFTGEEVLYRYNRSFAASEPIFEGIALYQKLTVGGPGHVLCNTDDFKKAEMWLKLNGVTTALCVVHDEDTDLDAADWYWKRIQLLKSQGPITAIITANSDVVLRCAKSGVHALLFVRPGSPVADVPIRSAWADRVKQVQERILQEAEEMEHEEEY